MRTSRIVVAAGLLLAACGDGGGTGSSAGPPASLEVLSGGNQSAPVGTELPAAVVVVVRDADGDPVPGQLVNFRVTGGGGTFFAGSGITDAQGQVRDRWTMGSTVGAQTAEARAVNAATGAPIVFQTFSATATAGPASRVERVSGDGQSGFAGTTLADSVTARVTDPFGNPVAGVPVTWTVATGGGTVSPTTSTTNAQGLARTQWTLGPARGPTTITASIPGAAPTTFSATITSAGFTASSISGGGSHTCALTPQGRAYCWGYQAYGQLGTLEPVVCENEAPATASCSTAPVAVHGNRTFTQLSAGSSHTCAVQGDGAAYCWGQNAQGQLGYGQATPNGSRREPTAVLRTAAGVSVDYARVTAGGGATCALTTGGAPLCWGHNGSGEVGVRQLGTYPSPTWVDSLPAAHALFTTLDAAGSHTCGITTTGRTMCWGFNRFGQLGTTTEREYPNLPTLTDSTIGFVRVWAGGYSSCALTADGTAYCWGQNDHGQLGDGTTTNRFTPTPVAAGGARFTELALGAWHACGRTTAGAILCWGYNGQGELGDGTLVDRPTPAPVAGGLTFAAVTTGAWHTCGIATNGLVWCWGMNNAGQLGDGTRQNRLVPVRTRDP